VNKSGTFRLISGTLEKNNIAILDTIEAEATIIGDNINVIEWIFMR